MTGKKHREEEIKLCTILALDGYKPQVRVAINSE